MYISVYARGVPNIATTTKYEIVTSRHNSTFIPTITCQSTDSEVREALTSVTKTITTSYTPPGVIVSF